MANGILVSFAGYPVMASSLFPDNGLASLAATLLAAGDEVCVLDLNTTSMLARLVPAQRTETLRSLLPALSAEPSPDTRSSLLGLARQMDDDLDSLADELAVWLTETAEARGAHWIGFKLWSGHGVRASLRMADRIRELLPRLRIYGGGPAVLYARETLYDLSSAFDALVLGEGEPAVVGLARHAEGRCDLADVPNLVLPGGKHTRRSLVEDLNRLPEPCYDEEIYPSLEGDEHIRMFVVDESRGCPMACSFCSHQAASGGRWRLRDAETVVALVESLRDRFGSLAFRLGGSYTPARFFNDLVTVLGKTDGAFRFCGFAHPEGLPRSSLDPLASAGCSALFLGVESFHPADLKRLGKRLRPERAREAIRACREASIAPVVSTIVPIPGQTSDALATTRDALLSLCRPPRATVISQFPMLLPGSPWWEAPEKSGLTLSVDPHEYLRLSATYRVRHILPPSLWEPLPVLVDGKDFACYARENAQFQQELASEGLILNVPDEVVLLADCLGVDLRQLQGRLREMLLTLDAVALRGFAREVNDAMEAR